MNSKEKARLERIEQSIFVDNCIISKDIYVLVAEKDMREDYDPWTILPESYLHAYFNDKSESGEFPWGSRVFAENAFKYPRVAHTEKGEMIIVGDRGEVWFHGLGNNKKFENNLPKEFINGASSIKNIHGVIYATGAHRAVVRRDNVNQWTPISLSITKLSIEMYEIAKNKGGDFRPGFRCIDGFEANRDLYAAGGIGDVWSYDGECWHSVDIPLGKMHVQAICCASDGFVYIAGRFGSLLKGRGDDWKIIKQDKEINDFRDIVEYNGNIYVCSENTLYTIEGDDIKFVDYGDELGDPLVLNALYSNHGLLLVSGSFEARLFDGETWKDIYSSQKKKEVNDMQTMMHITEELGDVLEKLDEAAEVMKK